MNFVRLKTNKEFVGADALISCIKGVACGEDPRGDT
jgi:hypothetical protein